MTKKSFLIEISKEFNHLNFFIDNVLKYSKNLPMNEMEFRSLLCHLVTNSKILEVWKVQNLCNSWKNKDMHTLSMKQFEMWFDQLTKISRNEEFIVKYI